MEVQTRLDYQSSEQCDVTEQKSPLASSQLEPTVALLHCYDLIEDFADTIGLSLEAYCKEFSCNYMFGYANALKAVGVRTVLFYISARVTEPVRFINELSGITIHVLPAPKIYRAFRSLRSGRRQMLNIDGEFSKNSDISDRTKSSLLTPLKNAVSSLGTYVSTPLGLLARELRGEGCQAILCQSYEYARFDACVLLGQLMRMPVVATFQGGGCEPRSFIEYLIRPLSLRACKGLIVAPQGERQRVLSRYKMPTAKVARIFNPLDVETWQAIDRSEARAELGIPLDARVLVSHGRIEIYNKGLDILLEAWDQICRDRPDKDLRLLLVGTGSDANELRQRITAMQLRGVMWRDEFVNDRTVIQKYLSAADVYTLASRSEGFPIAPTEAMACGLPVVATDAPGMAEILEGGEVSGGLVVPLEDAKALASGLGRVLDDEDWGREMGKRARRRVEEYFSPEAIGKQLRDFLWK
ncbi:glycosyltransferase family 4 protein [Trichocoleus sp. ST-U3]